jgi:carbamoyltransferase
MRQKYYVGLSATFHDPAVAIVGPRGDVLFAEAIERYTQDKRGFQAAADHLLRLPALIKQYCGPDPELVVGISFSEVCLRIYQAGGVTDLPPLQAVCERIAGFVDDRVYHDDHSWPWPTWKAMRALGRGSLMQAGTGLLASRELSPSVKLRYYYHHLTHGMFACHGSPFDEAVCAVIDGYGEFGSTAFFAYRDGKLKLLHPRRSLMRLERASLGFFYGLICGLCGFDTLKGEEWKVMGLAPYGRHDPALYELLRPLLKVQGLQLVPGVSLSEEKRILKKLRSMQRPPSAPPSEWANMAYTGQQVFGEVMRELLQELQGRGNSKNLVLSGGCALNSSYNGRILTETGFTALHVPSAPADDGNSVGAALLAYLEDHPPKVRPGQPLSPYLGSEISTETRANLLRFNRSPLVRQLGEGVIEEMARLLAQGKIIGWMQGRAEYGPRALGNRSILADPRDPNMKDRINGRVKFREEYRPFAPSILHEYGDEYFENYQLSPYMDRTLVFRPEVRARVPAVVHEDGTGRLQSVTREMCERFYRLIQAFHRLTGVPILLNTSFNIMGKPIIHSVEDAVGMFYTTGLDVLVVDDILFEKEG